MGRFAYCTLIMKGDGYIPGALIMGYSLKQVSSPDIDLIAMVTPDVSKTGKKLLSDIFNVVEVPYLEYESSPILLQTPKQKARYETWLSSSYTKWNMLKFYKYDKILFLDADVIVIKSIDDIFDFDTPAAVFSSPWSKSYYSEKHEISLRKGYADFFKNVCFGDKILSKNIIQALTYKGHVLIGSTVLLSPQNGDYIEMIKMLKNNIPFGFKVPSGNDEQAITYFYYLKRKKWTSLPPNLNTIPWKLHMLNIPKYKITSDCLKTTKGGNNTKKIRIKKMGGSIENRRKTKDLNKCNLILCMVPHIIHYFGDTKVWNIGPNLKDWDDLLPFWQLVYNYINSYKTKTKKEKLRKIFNIPYLKNNLMVKPICFWCKYFSSYYSKKINYNHRIINEKNELMCPLIKNCINPNATY